MNTEAVSVTGPVPVINFVSQGSVEEGMLQVLSFKNSLFAGVLDGGPEEVFMQGTRHAGHALVEVHGQRRG